MSVCLAVDIGGTKIAAALVDCATSHIIERCQIATPKTQQPAILSAALESLLIPFIAQADFVAVASTGIINNGILTALNPTNLGGLNRFELVDCIYKITQLPTYAINDAQAAAWYEFISLNPNSNTDNMLFITISTGIGGGLVLNQQLQTGARGISGHIGHTVVNANGPLCGCGRQGCIEKVASGTAIGEIGTSLFNHLYSGQDVYQLALEGNSAALNIIHSSAAAVAELIANLTITLDLDTVVIGGSVGLAPNYCNYIQQYLNEKPELYRPRIILAQSGGDAGLLGAASWFAQQQSH
ncbi:N-acetylmannosamine kinase [Photobacterium kishitanii]|uniref:N-acetylmannosamine kinase n=1 Tax=Photobacterium kishitanii TaxID=318456 RepID=UPI0005D444A9|nr:N-acetylmannosamine kinase [Photobacterium kishitanii]KJG10037.1 N-acetylmannosamine kinase [Photobacterium kishitanii]OBU26111.1 N-acetylmannosamine kinase [Photobacterium kishitanii]PSU23464.1 N-acetylmannosamine kinase [Photobacterium kishitanii]PSV02929.1 N-acetylmannosamine kinase [Photobacterium kishitanii]PSV14210.1 N-acetylmannosamine kinase [Photobacterium kishitanii]